MNKKSGVVMVALIIGMILLVGCGTTTPEGETSAPSPAGTTTPVGDSPEAPEESEETETDPADGESDVLHLQGSTVHIPPGYTAEGGWDAYRWLNGVFTPINPTVDHKIVLDYGMAWTSGGFDAAIGIEAYRHETDLWEIDTSDWLSEGVRAYTGYFNDGGTPTMLLGIHRSDGHSQTYLTVEEGNLEEHSHLLIDFVAENYITLWDRPEELAARSERD